MGKALFFGKTVIIPIFHPNLLKIFYMKLHFNLLSLSNFSDIITLYRNKV